MSGSREIATPRLLLRPLGADDRDLYVRLYSDPLVMAHLGEPRTPPEADAGFRQSLDLQACQAEFPARWVAVLRRTGQGVGLLGLVADAASLAAEAEAEAGVLLLPEAQRRGLAGEALGALAAAAFDRGWVAVLWARHAPANQAMARVLAGLGFEAEGAVGGECRWRLRAGRPENRSAGSVPPPSRLAAPTSFG